MSTKMNVWSVPLPAAVRRLLAIAACALSMMACSDPVGLEGLSDFMIRSPGDYFFSNMLQFRPSATSTDSIVFQWQEARGAERYTLVFKQVETAEIANMWRADLTSPTFTIAVDQPQSIMIPFGIPNPQLDTLPVPTLPALQHVVRLRDLDALIADQPRGVPLYFVWTIEAHKGSTTGRSVDVHRFSLIRG